MGIGSGNRRWFCYELCSAMWAWENHKFSGFCQIISNIYSNSSSLVLFSVGETSKIESTNQKSRGQVSDKLGFWKCLFACSSEWSEVIFVMVTQTQTISGAANEPMTLVNTVHNNFKCQYHSFFLFLFFFSFCFYCNSWTKQHSPWLWGKISLITAPKPNL